MKNRIIIMILFFWSVISTMMAEDKIYGNPFSICIGKTAEVEVLLDNSVPYVGFQFDLTLPYGVIVTGYEVNRSRIPASTEVSIAQQEDGSYRFFATALSLDPIVGNSGKIITLKLKATDIAFPGDLPVGVQNMKLSKADATGLTNLDWMPFTTAKVFRLGDVNGDGSVNVTDVGMVIDDILENTLVNYERAAADVNGDKEVNVTDVGLIIDIILSDGASAKVRGDMEELLDPQ